MAGLIAGILAGGVAFVLGEPHVNAAIAIEEANSATGEVKARVGKVTGIYVADVSIPNPGEYDIEFHVKNNKLDERLPLAEFKVE